MRPSSHESLKSIIEGQLLGEKNPRRIAFHYAHMLHCQMDHGTESINQSSGGANAERNVEHIRGKDSTKKRRAVPHTRAKWASRSTLPERRHLDPRHSEVGLTSSSFCDQHVLPVAVRPVSISRWVDRGGGGYLATWMHVLYLLSYSGIDRKNRLSFTLLFMNSQQTLLTKYYIR